MIRKRSISTCCVVDITVAVINGNTYSSPLIRVLVHFLSVDLTHWGRMTHICVSKLTIIGSDNGLSPDRRQAIIWTNAGLLLIGPLATNFGEILIEILTFSFKKIRLKVSSAKRRPFCLGLNVLNHESEVSANERSRYVCNFIYHWP